MRSDRLHAREKRRQKPAERRKNEEEVHPFRRFFKKLQERILRFVVHAARRDDEHFVLARKGRERGELGNSPRVFDREESVTQDDHVGVPLYLHPELARRPRLCELDPLLRFRLYDKRMMPHALIITQCAVMGFWKLSQGEAKRLQMQGTGSDFS